MEEGTQRRWRRKSDRKGRARKELVSQRWGAESNREEEVVNR